MIAVVALVLGVLLLPGLTLAFVLFTNGHEIIGLLAAFLAFARLSNNEHVQKVVEKVRVVEKIVYKGARMTKDEAYAALGLQPGATRDAIQSAYRSMMVRVHPDHGGSSYLAAKVNEARQVLVGGKS